MSAGTQQQDHSEPSSDSSEIRLEVTESILASIQEHTGLTMTRAPRSAQELDDRKEMLQRPEVLLADPRMRTVANVIYHVTDQKLRKLETLCNDTEELFEADTGQTTPGTQEILRFFPSSDHQQTIVRLRVLQGTGNLVCDPAGDGSYQMSDHLLDYLQSAA